ncbi:MAG: hypothetical protein RRY29_10655 [Desulfovibrionaceae bacterium]
MPRYSLCHIEGPNDRLKSSQHALVDAASFQEALATRTTWPVEENYNHSCATAQNPGTCTYYQELWEATVLTTEKH